MSVRHENNSASIPVGEATALKERTPPTNTALPSTSNRPPPQTPTSDGDVVTDNITPTGNDSDVSATDDGGNKSCPPTTKAPHHLPTPLLPEARSFWAGECHWKLADGVDGHVTLKDVQKSAAVKLWNTEQKQPTTTDVVEPSNVIIYSISMETLATINMRSKLKLSIPKIALDDDATTTAVSTVHREHFKDASFTTTSSSKSVQLVYKRPDKGSSSQGEEDAPSSSKQQKEAATSMTNRAPTIGAAIIKLIDPSSVYLVANNNSCGTDKKDVAADTDDAKDEESDDSDDDGEDDNKTQQEPSSAEEATPTKTLLILASPQSSTTPCPTNETIEFEWLHLSDLSFGNCIIPTPPQASPLEVHSKCNLVIGTSACNTKMGFLEDRLRRALLVPHPAKSEEFIIEKIGIKVTAHLFPLMSQKVEDSSKTTTDTGTPKKQQLDDVKPSATTTATTTTATPDKRVEVKKDESPTTNTEGKPPNTNHQYATWAAHKIVYEYTLIPTYPKELDCVTGRIVFNPFLRTQPTKLEAQLHTLASLDDQLLTLMAMKEKSLSSRPLLKK